MHEKFEFTDRIKRGLFWMMGAGVLGILLLVFFYPQNQHSRLWTNLLANTYFFTGIGLFGLFIVAATQLAYGGWQTLEKRIFLSMSAFTRVGGFLLAIILLLGIFGVHNLYAPAEHIVKAGPKVNTTSTINKVIYFGTAFWVGRVLFYAILWYAFSIWMDRFFARTDQTNPKVYKKSRLMAAAFLVTFALTESAVSWDIIMSLDPGWYSTIFGWYNFASYGCAAWGMSILLVLFLKSQGYLKKVNENHVHDLGKMLFVFSILWTYLWFDQFMLQWYGNIPEETTFWVKRFSVGCYQATVFLSLFINFVYPLVFLISRGAKRSFRRIGFGAAFLIFGHYIDFFNYTFVEPNWNKAHIEQKKEGNEAISKTERVVLYAAAGNKKEAASDGSPIRENTSGVATEMKKSGEEKPEEVVAPEKNFGGIGPAELLVFVGFLGVFVYMFFLNLAKRPIVPEDDPYLKEAENLVVTYA